ncbi:DsbA family protein [Streptomyces sp. NPDC051921]|uniref:2-hydroxychromene-2-carboxylate isomerase n=1 Tax=Streptomyces sp. NPDC051921 TaxID=3155806 RepID=UPI003414D28E
MALRFYFSLRSPYSWLAHLDLMAHHPRLAADLEWVPYWEPDDRTERLLAEAGRQFVYTRMSREKHFYILGDVRRLAAARGLTVSWPVDRDPVWEVPHLAYLAAERQGAGPAFLDLAYRARWHDGLDICARPTMAKIAGELGLDAASLGDAADDPELRARGAGALLSAVEEGVFGVPFFVNGREKYWGVDRLSAFVASLGPSDGPEGGPARPGAVRPPTAAEPPAGALGTTTAGGDLGHGGGCG